MFALLLIYYNKKRFKKIRFEPLIFHLQICKKFNFFLMLLDKANRDRSNYAKFIAMWLQKVVKTFKNLKVTRFSFLLSTKHNKMLLDFPFAISRFARNSNFIFMNLIVKNPMMLNLLQKVVKTIKNLKALRCSCVKMFEHLETFVNKGKRHFTFLHFLSC